MHKTRDIYTTHYMYKDSFIKRDVLVFHHFGNKGYSLFACLGREVLISVLSAATLSHAHAEGIGVKPIPADTVASTDRELMLDEVSVTGTRAPLTASQAARIVTVLDREAIQAAPVQSVNDLLKYASGVDVRQRGPIGAQTDISIRGGNQEQIAILLNGINICDPQTGHNAFDIPADISEIERIEVLEGPSGRVYGVSSLVGAINIVTRTAPQSSVTARVEGGSYGYVSAGARTNIAAGRWNNQISGSFTRSDGYSRNKQGGLNADFHGGKAFYQGSYADDFTLVKWHAGLSVKDFGSNTFYGAKWDDQFEHTMKTFTAIQAENKQGSLHLKPSIYWNRNLDRFELYRGDDGLTNGVPFNYHRTDVFGISLSTYFDWACGRTAVSAELRNEDLVSTTLGETLSQSRHVKGTVRDYTCGLNRSNISFAVEHNILLKRLTLSAGLVAVKNSWNNMNMRVYPGVDISYRIAQGLKLYASYNSSLRMPSVTELYYSVGGHKADKMLKPEELRAVEGGVKYVNGGVEASVSTFYNHCTNVIDWIRHTDEGSDAVWQSVNFTKINTIGVETAVRLDLKRLFPCQSWLRSFSAGYCYMDQMKDEPANIQSRSTLEYLRHKVTASLDLTPMRRLDISFKYRFQERCGTFTDANGSVRGFAPYAITDARVSWRADTWKLYVEANNLFNKSYYDFGQVPQPGLWLMAGVTVNVNL